MDAARHLELLRTEGDRLASMPADTLGATVPTMTDWTVERVVRHTGKIHQWAKATLAAPSGSDPAAAAAELPGIAKGPACLDGYRDALDAVVAELERHDPDEEMWTFAGTGNVAFWCRRQAHEVAVHRVDAADAVAAAGGSSPEPLAVDGAADAVDEWAGFFLTTRWGQRYGDLPDDLADRTIHIHGTDEPPPDDGAEWFIRFGDAGVEVTPEHAKGDTALRGTAQDLLLALWRRRPLDTLDVIGDRALAERLLDLARF